MPPGGLAGRFRFDDDKIDLTGHMEEMPMEVDIERGVLRLSFTHYTSQQELDQLVSALERVI